MSERPLVSVIIIFFNAEQFIIEAIESVFAQTYPSWELLLVDDGSNDGGGALAQQYARQWPDKVHYVTHAGGVNRGMSASRNLGLQHACGDYIAFLDADDVWLPQKLERQVELLQARPEAGMVYAPVQWWFDWTGEPADQGRDFVNRLNVEPGTLAAPPSLVTALLERETATVMGGLLRRAAASQVGGFEVSFGGMYEDQAFFAKLGLAWPIFVAGECWYKWRKHPASCCAVAVRAGAYQKARRVFLSWLEGYMLEQDVKDQTIWTALRQAAWRNEHPQLQRLKDLAQPGAQTAKQLIKTFAKRALPGAARRRLKEWWHKDQCSPPVGRVNLGNLRRLTPISRVWGFDRGQPVDRYYIESFLAAYAHDVRGHVLEIAGDDYTVRFGGARVTQSDVLHAVAGNPRATIVGDLQQAEQIQCNTFDCVICTQTLLVIYDVRAAIQTLHRILKPGGVLLLTAPGGAHQIAREDMEQWGDYWRFTSLSVKRLCEEVFLPSSVKVEAFGNVLTAISFLHGLAAADLRKEELDYRDPYYEVTITARAVKSEPAYAGEAR